MKSHHHTTSISSTHNKSYAQLAEQALFIAVISGFFVMAGGFVAEVLSFQSDGQIAAAPAHVTPEKAGPACDRPASC